MDPYADIAHLEKAKLIASMSVGAYTHILRTKESPRSLERITRALISTLSSLRRTPPLT